MLFLGNRNGLSTVDSKFMLYWASSTSTSTVTSFQSIKQSVSDTQSKPSDRPEDNIPMPLLDRLDGIVLVEHEELASLSWNKWPGYCGSAEREMLRSSVPLWRHPPSVFNSPSVATSPPYWRPESTVQRSQSRSPLQRPQM